MTDEAEKPEDLAKVTVGRLVSPRHVRRELARVYKELRTGKMGQARARTCAYVLVAITRTFEAEIHERVAALEAAAGIGDRPLKPRRLIGHA